MKIRIIVLEIPVLQRGCQSKYQFHNLDYQLVDIMNKRNKASSSATVVTHYKH